MDNQCDLIVIGAGISGLTLAHACAQAAMRITVLEGSGEIGGCVKTARFHLDHDEFWLELGAHTLFNSYGHLLAYFPRLGLDAHLQRRERLPFRLWNHGSTVSVFGALHWLDLARALPRAFTRERAGREVKEYFSTIAGTRNYLQVIGPALDGLLCQAASEFPADLLFKKRPRVRQYPRSFSLSRGLGLLVERLASGLDVRTGHPVERIRREGGQFICNANNSSFRADKLALAVPVAEAARLLSATMPAVSESLARILTATVESTGIVLPARKVRMDPVAGLIGREAPFYSMVSRDVVPDAHWRGFTFHFRPGTGEKERIDIAAEVLEVKTDAFLSAAHARHLLPSLRIGHGALIEAITGQLQNQPLALVGNYFGGISLEDCAARALDEAARLVLLKQ